MTERQVRAVADRLEAQARQRGELPLLDRILAVDGRTGRVVPVREFRTTPGRGD